MHSASLTTYRTERVIFFYARTLTIMMISFLGLPFSVAEMSFSQARENCVREFELCGTGTPSKFVDMMKLSCEAVRKDLQCEHHYKNAKPKEQEFFFSCESSHDVCERTEQNTSSLLISCGAGVGGLLWDAAEGLVMLPASVFSIVQNMNDPGDYKSCSTDYQAKLALLGEFKPEGMTKKSIELMSCSDVKKFVETKAEIILAKLEARRLEAATKNSNDRLTIYDLKLSQQEIQALNYDKKKAGPLRWAQCLRPEAAAKLACRTMTQSLMTVSGAAGTAGSIQLLKKFTTPKPKGSSSPSTNINEVRKKSWEEQTEIIQANNKYAENELKKNGVSYEPMPRTYFDANGNLQNNTPEISINATPETRLPMDGGKRFQIKAVPDSNIRGPYVPAVQHADMGKLLSALEKNDTKLIVDSSLEFMPITGRQSPGQIIIRPNTPWHVVQHEYQHLLFAKYIEKDFSTLSIQVGNGKDLSMLLPREARKAFSNNQFREMEKIMRIRSSQNDNSPLLALAVDERAATIKELELMGWQPLSTAKIFTEQYGLEFARTYLKTQAATAPLNKVQTKALSEIDQRIKTLVQRRTDIENLATAGSALKSSTGIVAAGVATEVGIAGVLGLGKEIYFNKEKNLMISHDPKTDDWKVIQGK